MAITVIGKIVITCVVLAVVGGLTATIVLVVNDSNEDPGIDSVTTTEPPGTVDPDILYEVGVGIADMTGPIVEIPFMGYAEPTLVGRGLHLRQFSRAFVFKQGEMRAVMVTADIQAVSVYVRRQVVKNLQALYGDIYTIRNVIICGTHTHSTPGGHLVEFLLDVSVLGFSQQTFDAYCDGITRSIIRAHENMVPARLYFGQTRVWDAHVNRSPYSYEFNPPEEKARYDQNTDNTLTQIRIVKPDGSLHGVMNWFAVHAVSMNMTNHLVSSDNLGIAALLLEKQLNPMAMTGKPTIVGGFFSSNIGDVSPNTSGPRCEFSGAPCDNHFVLCGSGERCYAQGPGKDMVDSATIVGTKLFEGAMEVLSTPGEELRGSIRAMHQFVAMPDQQVPRYDATTGQFVTNELVKGCVPSMGYSFAAGTTDGANLLNITHGTVEGIPLLDSISGLIAEPTEEDVACHAPKPILLATGRANFPLPWQPTTVSISLTSLGGVIVAGVPGEPTTMTGRRIRDVVGMALREGGEDGVVVVGGLTNDYISYVATFEEYQVQRYEGASTIYGPHTLEILLYKFYELATALVQGASTPAGPDPPDYMDRTLSLITPVVLDAAGAGQTFGDVIKHPDTYVTPGQIVNATFVAANPRNDLKQESTHAEVQRLELGKWITVATDADLTTRFHWERVSTIQGTSRATFEWEVSNVTTNTAHRILYYGVAKSLLGTYTPFTGQTDYFYVQPLNNS